MSQSVILQTVASRSLCAGTSSRSNGMIGTTRAPVRSFTPGRRVSARGRALLSVTASLAEGRSPSTSEYASGGGPHGSFKVVAAPMAEGLASALDLGKGKEVEARALRLAIETANGPRRNLGMNVKDELMDAAYERCREVTAEYAKTFYLGTKLMTPDKQRAIWAIYVWCRRTDELVDGPNAARVTPEALRRWDDRLEAIFQGKPYDMLDAALSDTVQRFPLDIQPFKDMVDGMRMDLVKSRYQTFDELYEYCYRVAGTVGLMSVPVMGVDPESQLPVEEVYGAALGLGLANQLTNILRDVGEDSSRGRIYVPIEDLRRFNITEAEVMSGMVNDKGVVDDRWKQFMKFQIKRARAYFQEAEAGALELDKDARWPVISALVLYSQILDSIEANDYNNFTKRAYVPKLKKFATLPMSYMRAMKK